MAYKVLYRKYRPQNFSDVVGQEVVTRTLKNAISSGRIAHAYLFTGSRGTGKTSCAKILAKAVNCLSPIDGDPCGICENCVGITNGSIMDVTEIDAASNNGINDVRSLIEEVAFSPASGKYRVYIIDEVHELSSSAFNALLKTLEEPPEHAVFILATTEVHKLLATILSRCQRFDFKRISTEDLAGRLEYIALQENASITHDAALMIARLADGGMRDAISILDQCMGRSLEVDIEVVKETAGVVGNEHLIALGTAILSRDTNSALMTIAQLHENSKDLAKLCSELITYFRHLMLIKTMGDQTRLIQMSDNEIEALNEQAMKTSLSVILHCLDTFQKTLDKMKFTNQRLELEMALIKLCTPELDDSTDALLRRIEALEQNRGSQTVAVKTETKAVKEVVAKVQSEPPVRQGTVKIDELSKNATTFKEWKEIVHTIKSYSSVIGAAFANSNAYINGDYILVDGSSLTFDYLRTKPDLKEKIRESILSLTGKNYKLGPYIKPKNSGELDDNNSLDMLAKKAEQVGINVKTVD